LSVLYVSGILHYQDHPEVDVSGVAKHRPLYDGILFEFRGYLKVFLLVQDEYETMARSRGRVPVVVVAQQGVEAAAGHRVSVSVSDVEAILSFYLTLPTTTLGDAGSLLEESPG
jgi:hypothetical protein